MIDDNDTPRIFALIGDGDGNGDEPEQIVGYGLVLPDGSAFSISWPAESGAGFYSTSSAEKAARLMGADVLWINGPP